jgi:photosystem II stability/assembly factor-like uncharacterized protein
MRATAGDGRVYGTNTSGKWGLYAELGGAPLVDLTRVSSTGEIVIASTGSLARSADGATFTRDATPPSIGRIVGLAARGDGTLVGLTTEGVLGESDDGGRSWRALPREPAMRGGAAVAISPVTHTAIAVGRPGLVRRLAADGTLERVPVTTGSDWLSDVAAGGDGSWWIVGDAGTVLRSTDDGRSFSPVVDPTGSSVADLYTASIGDDGALLAAGAHGTVVVSRDGRTLIQWPTGGELYVGAARWIEPGTALLLGEDSLVTQGVGL